ncbi:hypothetical protein FOL47_009840 [Perkinsus chesapeaki]|uniref:RING-type E3 ubiquitin transferase n=1 Tax=Perkinsus chesapeaki TaxID=330153 RepID=A0A7J6L680_PERCH|nr:hypothetical protein FOL47_009840 [Perkinsus chesapeaki]
MVPSTPERQRTGWSRLMARLCCRTYVKVWLGWVIIVIVIGIVLGLFCHGALFWLLIAVYASVLGVAAPCMILAFARYELMLEWHEDDDSDKHFKDWVSEKAKRYTVTEDDLEESLESSNGCCSICLAEYEPGECILELPCRHRFHEDCFRECFKAATANQRKCPMCRRRVGPKERPKDLKQNAQLMRIW